MPKFSRNPIVATATTTSPYQTLELEVFIETLATYDTYYSLGTFTYLSDSQSAFSEQIQDLLHCALMNDIAETMPENNTIGVVKGLCRKFKYRTRYMTTGTWGSWTDSAVDHVVLGGKAYENFNNTTLFDRPIFLNHQDLLLTPYLATGFVYVLAHEAQNLLYSFNFESLSGVPSSDGGGIFGITRPFEVVKIPIVYPSPDLSSMYYLSVEINNVVEFMYLLADFEYRPVKTDFMYLSSAGGWAFLPCYGQRIKGLEVSQKIAENISQGDYYSQPDIGNYQVWKSSGKRKEKVSLGYIPQKYIALISQDFLLSRKRFVWNNTIGKWLPVAVETKSVIFESTTDLDLGSFSFEFRYLFDNDIPSL